MEMEELNKSGKIKIVEVHTEMAVYYSRPKLESLSQKDRLSFIRQVRHLSLKELGMKMGIPSSQSKYRIWRMERKGRDIPPDVRSKVCEALDINPKMLEKWSFRDPEDLYYMLLWMEELYPDFVLKNISRISPKTDTIKALAKRYAEWKVMKKKYADGKITYEEYWDWKLRKLDEKGNRE